LYFELLVILYFRCLTRHDRCLTVTAAVRDPSQPLSDPSRRRCLTKAKLAGESKAKIEKFKDQHREVKGQNKEFEGQNKEFKGHFWPGHEIHVFRISHFWSGHEIHVFRISHSWPGHEIHVFRISQKPL
jgi:hypothetical protein